MNAPQGLSVPVEISAIGAAKLTKQIDATEQERAALAASLGLIDILALTAKIVLYRDSGGIIHLKGRLDADIVQRCVISLDPVRQTIAEPIRLRLATAQDSPKASKPAATVAALDIDPVADDPPEIVTGATIDIGAIVVEHLILAIDPYPRAPDAVLPDNPARHIPDSRDSPFAALAGKAGLDHGER